MTYVVGAYCFSDDGLVALIYSALMLSSLNLCTIFKVNYDDLKGVRQNCQHYEDDQYLRYWLQIGYKDGGPIKHKVVVNWLV